jgi:hypothetical protein
MILSHTHKFIFICSSKVGTSSMEEALRPFQEGEEYAFGSVEAAIVSKHIPPAILRGALPEKVWNEYFKFVFVRNPWDWFISQWFYNAVPWADARAERLRRLGDRARRVPLRLAGHALPPQPPTLVRPPGDELRIEDVDAVFEVLKLYKGLPGRDGLYQSSWVYDMDGKVIVDYVGHYETLESDFAEIVRHLGTDVRLPHLNSTGHRDYRSYYSDETRERVGDLWAIDVENFGYSFDLAGAPPGQSPLRPESAAISSFSDRGTAR